MISFYLLGLMVLVFMLQLLPGINEMFVFNPALAASEPWRFFTSMFMHGGVSHLFFNMFALIMFGPLLERKIGQGEFIKLFIIAGLCGSLLYYTTILIGIMPPFPALGASGAIFGILGALAVLMPRLTIFVMFIPMNIRHAAVLWIILELLGAFNPYSGIASAAHLGGLVFGIIYGKYIYRGAFAREEEFEFYH